MFGNSYVISCMKRFLVILFVLPLLAQELKIYESNKFGFRNISPDNIIENDEFMGRWNIYRLNNFGLREILLLGNDLTSNG